MKKSTIIIIAVVAVILLWGFSSYNGIVNQDETVKQEWANVEAQYQRRADLIPNLVQTVKGYAKHESGTLQAVVDARTKATQMTVDAKDLDPDKIKAMQAAQGELSTALGRLLAITEAYPDLKANENFKELQSQLEGTENRIAEARKKYNESVKGYNTSIRRIPGNIVAGIGGFDVRTPFEAAEGADKAPAVNFE